MAFRKVTAVIRRERLAEVEARLLADGLAGITVTPVKGFGEYANYSAVTSGSRTSGSRSSRPLHARTRSSR